MIWENVMDTSVRISLTNVRYIWPKVKCISQKKIESKYIWSKAMRWFEFLYKGRNPCHRRCHYHKGIGERPCSYWTFEALGILSTRQYIHHKRLEETNRLGALYIKETEIFLWYTTTYCGDRVVHSINVGRKGSMNDWSRPLCPPKGEGGSTIIYI